ncbi:MAG: SRPBCC domain-containing protein [Proteobacteria bacterium]|nr:SRPBCC domain-containing protein [Pseudomonadota bacterium]
MSTSTSRSDAKFVIERTYRSTLKEVWELWTTKEGFESWWGPQGFRADVHAIDARAGGVLRYDMVADTPEMIEAMKQMGQPPLHAVHARFTELKPRSHLVLTSVIDFLPGVAPYDNDIVVDFFDLGDSARMVVTLTGMHSEEMSGMQQKGFASQITKLDQRFGWAS